MFAAGFIDPTTCSRFACTHRCGSTILVSRSWPPIRSCYSTDRAGGIDVNERTGVINWVISFTSRSLLPDKSRSGHKTRDRRKKKKRNRFVAPTFVFTRFFPRLFGFHFIFKMYNNPHKDTYVPLCEFE